MGASLVYIGLDSLVDVPTLIALREIRAHGRDVTLLLTSRDDEAGKTDDDSVARNVRASMFNTRSIGGRARWQEIVREALGDLEYRRASSPLTPDLLHKERALIAERRRLRRIAGVTPRDGRPENEAHGDGEQDRDEVEGVRPPAAS
jgi:hypothetical protein